MKYVIAFGVALAAMVLYYFATAFPFFECGISDATESYAQDSSMVAKTFVRNCGATTPYYTVVTLRTPGLSSQDAVDDRVVVTRGLCKITTAWEGSQLIVSVPASCDIASSKLSWDRARVAIVRS